jgi:glyoxylase I family protein
MQRAVGIGGVFFRAKDPESLNAWYAEHLGVAGGPNTEDVWEQQAGPTVWSAFDSETDYFGRREQAWMVNFRVRDLDAMVAQLRAAGIQVEPGPQEEAAGRFARTHDPEGNPIELWEPLQPTEP